MKIKTADLTFKALSWAVAQAEKSKNVIIRNGEVGIAGWSGGDYNGHNTWTDYAPWCYWTQGGPIIEREVTALMKCMDFWEAQIAENLQCGPTPLIAAMRCFVASRLGDEVEIPDELLT